MEVVDKHPTSEVFVVNEKEEMLGIVSFIKIRDTILKGKAELQKQKALDFVNSDIPPLYLEDNLDLVIQQFGKINEDELPVVESEENKQLIGSVRLRDVIEAYNRELQRWDLTGGTHSILTASTKQRSLEITEDIAISELELPDRFVGKSISELNVRETYNLQILFIHKEQKKQDHLLIPESHYVFHRGDKILVMGNEKDIKKLGG